MASTVSDSTLLFCLSLTILTQLQIAVQPSLAEVQRIVDGSKSFANAPNLIPICCSIPSEFLTPSSIYLKVAAR